MSSDPEVYKRQAEAAYQLSSELLKSARAAQIEYGRWLVNTLWLMPPGTLVGLPFKAHAGEHPILLWSTVLVCGWYRFRFRRSIRGLVEFHLRDRAIPSPGPTLECFLILSIWPQQTRAKL